MKCNVDVIINRVRKDMIILTGGNKTSLIQLVSIPMDGFDDQIKKAVI
jgi:hypothetical protein